MKDELFEDLSPTEVLEILQLLARERKILFIKLIKVILEFFMILQFTELSETIFFIKIENTVIGVIGLLASIIELTLEQPFLKNIFKENPILIC